MTTPERFKRRQQIEGIILILLAVFTVLQAVYFQHQRNDTQACVERKFTELSHALDVRGQLSKRETKAERAIWIIYGKAAGAIKDPEHPHLSPEDRDRFNRQLIKALLNYVDVTGKIQEERAKHPIPPYPAGACDTEE